MPLRLDDLKPDALVQGLVGREAVRIVSAEMLGDAACKVVYRGQDGVLGEQLLFRSSEAELDLVSGGRKWSFEGSGDLFRLVSEAARIELAYLFDPYVAVSSSTIDPLPHQISAVYEHMLPRQPMRFLLADDPGAGKTIMAGLLIKELLIRGELERCLIVAPGSLTEQWQDELKEKFELNFELLTRDLINATGLGNPFEQRPLLIARMDMLSRDEELQSRLEQAPEWDLVVCDESHRMSAHYFGSEVKRTKRYDMGKRVGNHARNLLLMTATPHNGKEEDFQLFMALLDEDRFAGHQRDAVHRSDPTDLMRRLVKEDLYTFHGTKLFPERRSYTAEYELSDAEKVLYERVTEYVRDEMNRADRNANQQGGGKKRVNVGFALMTLQRRQASSPFAIHRSLERRRKGLESRLKEERLLLERRSAESRLQLDAKYQPGAISDEDIDELYEEDTAESAPYLDYRPLKDSEHPLVAPLLSETWLGQGWDALVLQHAMTTLVPEHLEEVKAEQLERIAKAEREIKARMQREINHWSRRYEELKLQEQAGMQVRLPAQVAKERAEVLVSRLEQRLAQLQAASQITAKVPTLKGGALVIPAGLLLAQQGQTDPEGVDAAARKRVELLAMNAVLEAEKALGRMPKDVSVQRGLGYDIESIDAAGNLFFIEVKGRADGADSVTLTINEVNTGRNSPHRFPLALVMVEGDRASPPVYVSGVDWSLPGFGDTQITKNLQQLLATGRDAH